MISSQSKMDIQVQKAMRDSTNMAQPASILDDLVSKKKPRQSKYTAQNYLQNKQRVPKVKQSVNQKDTQSMESFVTPREVMQSHQFVRQSDKVLHEQIQQKARENLILKQGMTPSKAGLQQIKSPYRGTNSGQKLSGVKPKSRQSSATPDSALHKMNQSINF